MYTLNRTHYANYLQDGHRATSPVLSGEREEITFEAKILAIGAARRKHGADVAHGFMLPSFLFYDACVVGFLTLSFGLALWSVEEPPWMLWTCAHPASSSVCPS